MKMELKSIILGGAAILAMSVASCGGESKPTLTKSGLDPENFKAVHNGKETALYTLTNANGMEACITNYGGRIGSLMVPDRDGNLVDVVIGFDSIADYINIDSNYGAAIGRYGNRINQGRFTLNDSTYQLPQNDGPHSLHGGPIGFHHSVWDAEQPNDSTLKIHLLSPDGEAGYPGNLDVNIVYTLLPDNSIDIAYEATTDKPSIVNLTNHAYFCLSGDPSKDILGEIMFIDADSITPIDSTFMTTGEMMAVEGTPFDFTTAKAIGQDMKADNDQLRYGNGIDHNYVLNKKGDINNEAITITDQTTGIVLSMFTDEPGIQVYTGNFLDGSVKGKGNLPHANRAAICIESQHYPDSPNKPQWPSVIVNPGDTYTSHTIYRFSTDK